MNRVIIFHNIISPYKTLLFNELNRLVEGKLTVVYFGEIYGNREWTIDFAKIEYNYVVLNKGNLDNVSASKLCWQVFSYLQQHVTKQDVFIAGEYIKLAYWIPWLYSKITGNRFAVILESHEQDRRRNILKEFIKKVFFAGCDLVFAAGEKHKAYAEKLGMKSENVFALHGVGGVDKGIYSKYLNGFSMMNAKAKVCIELKIPEKKYFIYVGRFSPEKNIMCFLHCYTKLVKKYGETWGLLLVGNGPEVSIIKKYISDNALDSVFLPGFVQQDKLPLYYLASDVFVLPSISEPWGLVVDEAIAMGKPILISERCGCIPDIVRSEENGLLFDPLSERQLYNAIEKIVKSEAVLQKYGSRSLEISKKYTSELSANIMAGALRQGEDIVNE